MPLLYPRPINSAARSRRLVANPGAPESGRPLASVFARVNFDQVEGLFEDAAALRATESRRTGIAADAGGSRLGGEWSFFDDGPNVVVADAADEVALGSDDVLEELIVGIAGIDDVKARRFQRGPQLLGFRSVAGRHSGFDRSALEHVELTCIFAARC